MQLLFFSKSTESTVMSLKVCTHGAICIRVQILRICKSLPCVQGLSFQTDKSGQIVQTQIRLLLEEQSDQGLHCLLFHLHNFDKIPLTLASLFEF